MTETQPQCERHGVPLVSWEQTQNGEPWLCAICTFETLRECVREAEDLRQQVGELRAIATVACDIAFQAREARA